MDEKVEKRRSSILKFKKPTTDNIQEVETVVKRRVSFSQKKFVKEFDAASNTMQNSTYEEIAKECDSGQSLDKMEVEENQFIYQHSSTHTAGVQIASSILLSQIEKDKENINPVVIATQNTVHTNINRSLFNPSNVDFNLSKNNAKVVGCPEQTILKCNTMDLTAFIPSTSQTFKNNHTVFVIDNMDITNIPINNEKTIIGEFNAETMDFTHVVYPLNRTSVMNETTRTEAMEFTMCNRQVDRQSVLSSEIKDATPTQHFGSEAAVENVFGQKQFSNTLFSNKTIKDTMDLTYFVCKNGIQINSDNMKENCAASPPQEQSCMDMDLTGINDNYIEEIVLPNPNISNVLASEMENNRNCIISTDKNETRPLNTTRQQLLIKDISTKETSSNALHIVESDKLLTVLNYAKEKSLPVYDVGGGIVEQIQNSSIRDKMLSSPFIRLNALTSNLNKWDCDSRKNSLINYTTTNYSVDDTEYLINFSVGGNKNPKSDFSRLIAGDFNPSFLSSKFLPLGEFESDAFTNEALESLHSNPAEPENQKLAEESSRKSTNEEKDCFILQQGVTQQITEEINENEMYVIKNICISPTNPGHNHIESNGTLKRSYDDPSNDVRSKIPKLNDVRGTNNTYCITASNTFMSEIMGTDTKNISDESVVSFCNNSSEDILEIPVKEMQNEKNNIQEDTNKVDELQEVFQDLYIQLVTEINENQTVIQKEIQTFEHRHLRFEKQQSYFEEVCQKISTLLNINYDIPIEKLKLNETHSSLEGQSCTAEISSVSGSLNEFPEIDKELQIMCEKVVTIQERIEQLQKTCQNYWCLISSTPEEYIFETLYRTIIIIIGIDRLTGIVNNLCVKSKPADDCSPQNLFIKKEFIKRMNSKTVSGAVGEKYDIVTLLDYIQMEMVHMTEMKKYFFELSRIGFEMDYNFRVTLKIPSLILRSVWVVTVNMSDLDNIDQNCLSIKTQVGVLDEEKVKSLLEPCPRGFAFLKHLVVTILNYQNMLENRKKK